MNLRGVITLEINITGVISRFHERLVSVHRKIKCNIQEVHCVQVGVRLNAQPHFGEELTELLPQGLHLSGSGRGHQEAIVTIEAYQLLGDLEGGGDQVQQLKAHQLTHLGP